ncbi:MAG: hypothetical protein U0892_10350 [Pirellulales bacterium]
MVVIIGEHGDYPKNEKGQTQYPRVRGSKNVVRVFEESGLVAYRFRAVHLSTDQQLPRCRRSADA